jgi:16S rRNA U1498 N3-methylase RsmE
MHSRQVAFFTMGCRILRMETAAILAPALALMALGEMGLSE